jgi:cytochrome P450
MTSTVPMNRVAQETVTLTDGTVIPKGAGLGIPITAMTDEKFHKDPLTFDGHRFYNLRQQPGNETKYQFVTTSNEHISFGHGKHACPGRFFASNEIKIALVQMLTTYDFRFPPGKSRPVALENGASMAPDPTGQIQYRCRQDMQ